MLPDDDDNPIDALDTIYEEAALADADDKSLTTPEDRARAAAIRNKMLARLAEKRRALLPADAAPMPARPIRPRFLAMVRHQLEATLDAIDRLMGPDLQVAHRNLSELSDDDLRRLLETIVPPEE